MKSSKSHQLFKILIFAFILSNSFELFGQFPVFSREQRTLKKADEYYAQKDYSQAIQKYKDYIVRYEGNPDIWYKLAVSFQQVDQPEKATVYYNRIIKLDDQTNPIVHLSLGQVYMMQGEYVRAREQFLKYNELLEFNDQLAMRYISSIENIDRYYADTAYFKEINLPINSSASDFSASSLDDAFYFLSTRDKKDDVNERYSSDLYISNRRNGDDFDSPKRVGGPTNTKFGEIGYTIYPKNKEIFICRFEPGKQDEYSLGYNLYKAFIGENNEISKPSRFELESFRYAISYPTLTKDGKRMIFASDAPGGFGGWDLYQAEYTNTGIKNIQNLGEKINSSGDELYPYMLNDTIVFFATDGHGGLGGFDIYSKNIANNSEYAKNIGHPLNSPSNDYAVYFDSGLSGYFTSNRDGGKGNDDIYQFTIHQLKLVGEIVDDNNGENLKSVNISVNRSIGNDEILSLADNGKLELVAAPGEKLEITVEKEGYAKKSFSVDTKDMVFIGNHSLKIGKLEMVKLEPEPIAFELDPELVKQPKVSNIFFTVQIAASRSVIRKSILRNKYNGDIEPIEFYDGKYYRYLLGKHESYFEAKEIWKDLGKDKTILAAYKNEQASRVMKALKEAHVEPAEARDPKVHEFIDKTEQISSRVVYYGLDKFRIPAGSENELYNINKILVDNPDYFLEIAAHTDKRGSDLYNRALSEERARFLKEYFIEMGISELRIISHGIGEKQLKKYCADCSEADHKQNRRAELIIRAIEKK